MSDAGGCRRAPARSELTAAPSSTSLSETEPRGRGNRLSEIAPAYQPSTCPRARATVFAFPPSDGKGAGVTLAIVEDVPPTDAESFTFAGPVLTLPQGR